MEGRACVEYRGCRANELHATTRGIWEAGCNRDKSTTLYPGSLKIVDEAILSTKLTQILGWDIGGAQVASYLNKSGRITVEDGDGYSSANAVTHSPKLIFCDPFWSEKAEVTNVQGLLEQEPHVIVWYPISENTEGFRKWLSVETHSFIEVHFRHWKANRLGWAGQDSRGAGLMMKGLNDESFTQAVTLARTLKNIFEGQTHSGKPRKGKNGKTIVPQDRTLSLRVTASW
ncbi:23S rRNA (adenine(2030)-N(6))-methyltransferase RlmJ [Bremerella cremea]|uniref:23S rRNA (Adenine(2030)-N(6))-methyltransferase RlmJ n=1 Tax=Bremerella cremea TaxID=1031537 RepID=A0A368KRY6_9BACT|nr:23S rRNA (adenine(2030)-N(6))-methyltransferase RlmJ [Bremerella cremea]